MAVHKENKISKKKFNKAYKSRSQTLMIAGTKLKREIIEEKIKAKKICRRNIRYCIIVVALLTNILVCLIYLRPRYVVSPLVHYHPYQYADVSCHQVQDHALPRLNESITTDKRIFFHETSCKGGLDPRQACAVESAARANPDWRVEVLFLGPVNSLFLKGDLFHLLRNMSNVVISRINLLNHAMETPLEFLFTTNMIYLNEKWRMEHISDLLRYLTLYKHGGVYLDLDMIVVRSFNSLSKNWVGKATDDELAAGAIGFSNDDVGRRAANMSVDDIKINFNPFLWDDSSVGVLVRVLQKICSETNITRMTPDNCSGFNVYDSRKFYPVGWREWKQYLKPTRALTLSDVYTSYAHHMWNLLSLRSKIPPKSRYNELAKHFCPNVYNLYGEGLGL